MYTRVLLVLFLTILCAPLRAMELAPAGQPGATCASGAQPHRSFVGSFVAGVWNGIPTSWKIGGGIGAAVVTLLVWQPKWLEDAYDGVSWLPATSKRMNKLYKRVEDRHAAAQSFNAAVGLQVGEVRTGLAQTAAGVSVAGTNVAAAQRDVIAAGDGVSSVETGVADVSRTSTEGAAAATAAIAQGHKACVTTIDRARRRSRNMFNAIFLAQVAQIAGAKRAADRLHATHGRTAGQLDGLEAMLTNAGAPAVVGIAGTGAPTDSR